MIMKFVLGLLVTLGTMSLAQASDATYTGPSQIDHNQSYPPPYTQFDWGLGRNGYGYCYEFTMDGRVLNNGQPVNPYNCERTRPSRADWGRGIDGWGYCFQMTPYGVPMNEGRSIDPFACERNLPSYYSWGPGRDGYTYCFQFTPYGVPMNQGRSVPNYFCGR